MQSKNYSFLDLTVMPFLRRKVISAQAALVFNTQLRSILWANAAGTKLFGGNNVGELLEIDLSNASELMGQVNNALTQIQGSETIVRGYRVSKGITSQLIKGELSFETLPNGSQVVLLVFAENKNYKRKKEHELAAMAVDSLEGFADAAAIVDEFGLTIASSSKFDDMNVYPTVLQDLVKVTASENDRMVKRPIEQFANKRIAAGIGRIRDVPGRYLIVLADLDDGMTPSDEDLTVAQPKIHPQNEYSDLSPENDPEHDIRLKLKNEPPEDIMSPEHSDHSEEFYEFKVNRDEPSLIDRLQFEKNEPNNPAESTISDAKSEASIELQAEPLEPSTDETQNVELTPLRFSFTIGADKIFHEVSSELAKSVGAQSADIIGLSWTDISTAYGFDRSGAISKLLEKADTWAGKSVLWPVQDTDMQIPLDLAALPIFTKNREFDGFRGFGVIRSEDAVVDTENRGLRLNEIRLGIKSTSQDPQIINAELPSGEQVPGILSDSWESDTQSPEHSESDDKPQNPIKKPVLPTRADEEKPLEEQLGSNVTSLNIVPIRSHVEVTKNISTLDDEDAHDKQFEEHDRATDNHTLNQKERSAFDQIRRRLQRENELKSTTLSVDNNATGQDVVSPTTSQQTDSEKKHSGIDDASNVDFGSAVLVYRADETLFANDALLNIAGYESLEELTEAGGLEALLLSDQLEGDEDIRILNLKRKDGTLIKAQPILKRVNWEGAKALSLTFIKVENKLMPIVDASKVAEPSVLDMVRVSDLESILDTATDGIIIINSKGEIEALNASGEALFGKPFDDVKGSKFTSLFAKESKKNLDEYFSNLSNAGVTSILNDGREAIGVEANGGMIPLFISLGAIGASNRYCAVLRDLTEWKKSEESLVTAKRKAEAASDQKTEFLSRISHEIREPLTAIIGFSDVMIEERFGELDNARYREYLRDINRSGIHMLDLVNDLLDISKIEAGKLELSYESVDLNLIARETVAMLQPQANSKRIIIRTSLSRAVPNVVADIRSIRQIITNLVSNAIKFSPQNSQVIVSTTYESNGEVGLRIRDTGHGMNAKELKLALEPYSQISNDEVSGKGGTGLGLPLTKALVEANRAYFDLESTPGEGTIAHVQFPSPRVLAD